MDQDFPPLSSTSGKHSRDPSPDQAVKKTPRTTPDPRPSAQGSTLASFLLRAATGARVFSNPKKVSQALNTSGLGKYILEGETRSLGNGSALVVGVWEHNVPKVPELGASSFDLGEWSVTCRRADWKGESFTYARVGPLADDTTVEEVQEGFRAFDGGEVLELSWIPPRHLPRTTTGKWLRLKVRGIIPTRISISQVVYRPRPYLLPLLRCPGCQKIGHSINTCRSAVRCSRCSGPHPARSGDVVCALPFHCFQCGGPHGPRSVHCPHNHQAEQLYASLAQAGTPLHDINKRLRDLPFPRRTPAAKPSPAPPAASLPRQVTPDVSFSSVTTSNRFTCLQDPQDDPLPQDLDAITPAPASPPACPPGPRPARQLSRSSHLSGIVARPPTPAGPPPTPDSHLLTTTAEVHQPACPVLPPRPSGPIPPAPRRPQPSPAHLARAAPPASASPSPTPEGPLSTLFTLLCDAAQLYHQGTSFLAILVKLWPSISMLLSSLFQQ